MLITHHLSFHYIKREANYPTQLPGNASTEQPDRKIILWVTETEILEYFVSIEVDCPARDVSPKSCPKTFIEPSVPFLFKYEGHILSVRYPLDFVNLRSTFQNLQRHINEISNAID